ncbi:mitogen activated protein kinase kinase, putative [Ricinus communis]|uniref:mitogen-activated protein kinase kinase n=1 Tax=Ricinus communis TaxID=3988 RepID=B9RMU2_RICCO|nr:mitogen activated protein kinase kinase, putative [Ricinus communis]
MDQTCSSVFSSSSPEILNPDRKRKRSYSSMALGRNKVPRNLHISPHELNIQPRCSPSLPLSTTTSIVQEDLEKLCVLGSGNYGIVYKVRHRSTSTIYALRIIHKEITTTTGSDASHSLSQEIEILTTTDSPFLVKCHGYQACKLLVNKDMKVKSCDFGVSKIGDRTGGNNNPGSHGTYAYMSPVGLDSDTFGLGYPFAGDVWRLGVTWLELYVRHYPFFLAEKRHKLDGACNGDIFWRIRRCAAKKCIKRISRLPQKWAMAISN